MSINNAINEISIPVSPGELLDKISILKLKAQHIHDAGQLQHVQHELSLLNASWQATGVSASSQADRVLELSAELEQVNARLWDIEDALRAREAQQAFDTEFIELARQVYITNDHRAALKKMVNQLLGSQIQEEKSYSHYAQSGAS